MILAFVNVYETFLWQLFAFCVRCVFCAEQGGLLVRDERRQRTSSVVVVEYGAVQVRREGYMRNMVGAVTDSSSTVGTSSCEYGTVV